MLSESTTEGEIVGRIGSEEARDAWIRTAKGRVETFDFPGAPFTEAFEITDKGVISGWFTDTTGLAHGFVRDAKGGYLQIDVPGGAWTIVFQTSEIIQRLLTAVLIYS